MGVIISSCFTVFPSAAPKSPALEGAPLLGSKSGEKGTISGSLGVGLKAGWLVSCTRPYLCLYLGGGAENMVWGTWHHFCMRQECNQCSTTWKSHMHN